jgi:lysophospholipase
MSFSAAELVDSLPQSNRLNPLKKQWQDYFEFYAYADVLENYIVDLDCLQQEELRTHYQHYRQPNTSIGTCIIVHGYTDHSGLYRHLITNKLQQGWDVLIYDLIGHGLSSGEPYAIDHFYQYALQLQQILDYLAHSQDQTLTSRWQLIGQSTGSAIIMEYVFSGLKDFKQITEKILLAPLVRSHQFLKVKLQYQALRWFMKKVKRRASINSHDVGFLALIHCKDTFRGNQIAVSWVGAMLRWEKDFLLQDVKSDNLFIIQGTDDHTVDWRYNLSAIKQVFPHCEQVMVDNAKHHLVNETPQWRFQVFDLIAEYSQR